MKKRDIISEILSKRSRLSYRSSDAYQQAEKRLTSIIYVHFHLYPLPREDHKEIKQELVRYFSVGLVSCIEGYYRAIVKELIDHGPPFRDNAHKLNDLKFDISTFTQLHDKKISIGEIVSHLVKIFSVGDIQKHMSTLLECDYFSNIQPKLVANDRAYSEVHPHAWEVLNSTFLDRHIACHELNPKHKWTFPLAQKQWRVVIHTLGATEDLLQDFGLRKNRNESS